MAYLRSRPSASSSPSPRPPHRLQQSRSSCVDVQWTFLSPSPTSSSSLSAPLSPPLMAASLASTPGRSPRTALAMEQWQRQHAQEEMEKEQRHVLQDLLGETQRRAMLDKVMVEMEAMMRRPTATLRPPGGHDRGGEARGAQYERPRPRRSTVLENVLNRGSPHEPRSHPANALSHSTDLPVLDQRARGKRSVLDPPVVAERVNNSNRNSDSDSDSDSDNSNSNSEDSGPDEASGSGEGAPSEGTKGEGSTQYARQRRRNRLRSHARSRRQLSVLFPAAEDASRILWQRSAHVKLARDVPSSLHADWKEIPTRVGNSDVLDEMVPVIIHDRNQEEEGTRKEEQVRRGSPTKTSSGVVVSPRAAGGVRPARRARYGSWYVPREQWWPLHQREQSAHAEMHPSESSMVTEDAHHHHCHHPHGRNHKPALPVTRTAAMVNGASGPHEPPLMGSLSGRLSVEASIGVAPSAAATTTIATTTTATAATVPTTDRATTRAEIMARRAAELQHEIPRSYIAREYRNYITAKGARLPTYLNY